MRRTAASVLSVSLLLGAVCVTTPHAVAQEEVGSRGTISAQQLMQSLLPYGVWMAHPRFGWVWQPHDVQPWWQPFSVGEWIVTDDGSPYWHSGYPFGWATEHYGSWTFDENKGWLWVPSNDWSAAPVSWRAVQGVIGWAPALATESNVQAVACPQPAMAWIFVPTNRLMATSNFAVAEQELMSRDAHGTWGSWAQTPDGPAAHRVPEPRNSNLLDATTCLGAAEAKAVFLAAVKARGGSTKGPPIEFVLSYGQMGTGRVVDGDIRVYAPVITGNPPAVGGDFLVNPPAQRIERAQPAERIERAERAAPVGRSEPAQRIDPVQSAPPAIPAQPAAPAAPLTPYEAYSYQHAQLNEHLAQQYASLKKLHESDEKTPPHDGFDTSKLPQWRQRELDEMQKMAARQRKLLQQRQDSDPGAAGNGGDGHSLPPRPNLPPPTPVDPARQQPPGQPTGATSTPK